jgi:hypothetical protein
VVASLIAAYMSTIGTHLNWGSSYAVNDFYKRFIKPEASEKELVNVGRVCTVLLMVIAGIFALTFLEDATQAFKILTLSGAGTGAIYILRWFWWRINAWTEIVAMIVATVVAFWMVLGVGEKGTIGWFVGSSAVAERVFVIDDADVVENVKVNGEQSEQAKVKAKEYKKEIKALTDTWKKARKESAEARDTARNAYDAKVAQFNAHKESVSVATLVNAAKNKTWNDDLQKFYTDQKQWQLERVNIRRVKSGLEKKKLEDISVGFAGILSGDKVYIYHPVIADLTYGVRLMVCVIVVSLVWILTTLITKPADKKTLRSFYRLCHPGGPGWSRVVKEARKDGEEIDQKNAIGDWKLPVQILCVFLGCVTIYSSLFAVGNFVYGNKGWGFGLIGVAVAAVFALFKAFGKIGAESRSD